MNETRSAGSDAIQPLVSLGLTALEAEIYAYLLRESAATGYGIAKALGKATPNVYKALETLQAKGAVVVDEDRTRRCQAVPAAEFLSSLERRFRHQRDQAATALARLPEPASDTRVYQLRDVDQVYERAHTMLAGVECVALLDAFPGAIDRLGDDLARAVNRDVRVGIKAYDHFELDGAEIAIDPHGDRVRKRWPGQWMNLATDGSEFLMAFLDADQSRVIQSIWTRSPYLAWIFHTTQAHEHRFTAIAACLEAGDDLEKIRSVYRQREHLTAPDAPGYRRLAQQLGIDFDGAPSS